MIPFGIWPLRNRIEYYLIVTAFVGAVGPLYPRFNPHKIAQKKGTLYAKTGRKHL